MISFFFKRPGRKGMGTLHERKTKPAALKLALKLLGKNPHVDHREYSATSEKGQITHVRGILLQDLFPVDPALLAPVQKKIDRLQAQQKHNDDRIRQLIERRHTLSLRLSKLGMERQGLILEAHHRPEKAGIAPTKKVRK